MLSILASTSSYRSEIQIALLFAVLLSAWRWGAGPERASAIAISLMWVLTYPYDWLLAASTSQQVDKIWYATVDIVSAAALIWIALSANRIYPLCIAAFQLFSVASHLMWLIDSDMNALAYSILSIAPSWLELTTMVCAIYLHHRRQMHFGPYRSWRVSSPLLQAIDPIGYHRG